MFGNIAVIGAGPAGSRLSCLLSKQGLPVTLYESKAATKEKPCAGGLTHKVFAGTSMPQDLPFPARPITRSRVISWDGTCVDVTLQKPVTVVTRSDLDRHLLEKSLEAGTRFINKRVRSLDRANNRWALSTRGTCGQYDLVVGADGINSLVRKRLSRKLRPHESYKACGYFVKGLAENRIVIKFFRGLEGYAWVFPGPRHASVGICGSGHKHGIAYLRTELHGFMASYYSGHQLKDKEPFAWLIPSMGKVDFKGLKMAGRNWALVGDAAGLADPITGEGIYYAIRSSEILVQCILANTMDLYPGEVHRELGRNLTRAASLKEMFFSPPFIQNTVLLAKGSPAIRNLVSDLYSGAQDYVSLERRLVGCILPCVKDMFSPKKLQHLGRALLNMGQIVPKYMK